MGEARVRGILTATDRTGPAVSSATKNLRKLETSFKRIGSQAKTVGKSLSLGLTAPLVGFGALALRTAGSFEASMNRVEAKAKVAEVSIADLTDQAKELGRTTQFSARQAAEAQEILATAGFNTTEIFGSLPGVLNLAAAGALELSDAAGFTASTLKNFNLGAEKSADVADLLAKGSLLANQTVADLGAGMAKAGATANAFGVSITDTAAALSALAEKNVVAEEGGTAFTNFLLELKNPASKARKYLDDLGLSITNVDGTLKTVNEVLATFNKAGITAANATDVFQKKVARTFIQLEQAQGAIKGFNDELEGRTGTAAEVAAKNLEGLNGELTKLKSAFEGVQISLADAGLLSFATELVAGLGGLVGKIAELNPELLKLGISVSAVVASIGPAIFIFGQLAVAAAALAAVPATFAAIGATVAALGAAIAAMAVPIGVVVGAIAAIGLAVTTSGNKFREFLSGMTRGALADIRDTVSPLLEGLVGFFKGAFVPALRFVGQNIATSLVIHFRIFAKVLKLLKKPLELVGWILGTMIPEAIQSLIAILEYFRGKVISVFRTAVGWARDFYGWLNRLGVPAAEAADDVEKEMKRVNTSLAGSKAAVAGLAFAFQGLQESIRRSTAGVADSTSASVDQLTDEAKRLLELQKKMNEEAGNLPSFNQSQRETEARRERQRKQAIQELGNIDLSNVEMITTPLAIAIDQVGTLTRLFLKLGPAIAAIGFNLYDDLIGALDIFDQRSQTTWQLFEQAGKNAINALAQSILDVLVRSAISSLLSFIPGVGPALAAFAGGTNRVELGPATEFNQQPQIVNNYNSLVPGTTADFVRAEIAMQESRRREFRFAIGGA